MEAWKASFKPPRGLKLAFKVDNVRREKAILQYTAEMVEEFIEKEVIAAEEQVGGHRFCCELRASMMLPSRLPLVLRVVHPRSSSCFPRFARSSRSGRPRASDGCILRGRSGTTSHGRSVSLQSAWPFAPKRAYSMLALMAMLSLSLTPSPSYCVASRCARQLESATYAEEEYTYLRLLDWVRGVDPFSDKARSSRHVA
jgi:hypothetical protein